MLTREQTKDILEFVNKRPRTISEIAQAIARNWRTADSYIQKIADETGQLQTHTFRQGTRGALKIVYWVPSEQAESPHRERLTTAILRGRTKDDFSPLDIFQYVDARHRKAFIEEEKDPTKTETIQLEHTLLSATRELFIFSGNLSWSNLSIGRRKTIDIFRELLKRQVMIKIIAGIDMLSIENIKIMLRLKEEFGSELIEIRHAWQPLRGMIVDDERVRFKEVVNPRFFYGEAVKKRSIIIYDIFDPQWVSWSKNLFWNIFRSSITADKRIDDINSIGNLIR
ncbi:MAG: hypothetical protein H6502_00220 [Candidatus Woesearchaeota archaeon]|nr:MAG: hypothetical protein H6502_00220 [Candidatus Woesearchaeota archaeon]